MFAGCLHVSLHMRFHLAHRILNEPRKENEQICFRGNQHSVSEAFLFLVPVTAHRLHRLSASINSRGDFFIFFLMMNFVSAHEHVGFSLSFVFHLLKKKTTTKKTWAHGPRAAECIHLMLLTVVKLKQNVSGWNNPWFISLSVTTTSNPKLCSSASKLTCCTGTLPYTLALEIQFKASFIVSLNVTEAIPLCHSPPALFTEFPAEMWPDSWNDPPVERGRPWIMLAGEL